MATAYAANERAAIEDVIQLYIDGVSKGDTDKLQKVFHGDAWMFGSLSGTRYDVPISQLIDIAVSLRRRLLTDYGPSRGPGTGADRNHDEEQAGADLKLMPTPGTCSPSQSCWAPPGTGWTSPPG